MLHAPASFFAHKGPPGWTRKTCSSLFKNLKAKIPALSTGIPDIYKKRYISSPLFQ
jgi:hypothetical protein